MSATELRELAQQAADSSQALEDLRAVTSVEGQPVDIDAALEGARGDELDQRLEALADEPAPRGELSNPRTDAREILEQDRFHGNEVPGPFRGILDGSRTSSRAASSTGSTTSSRAAGASSGSCSGRCCSWPGT